jgi:hypothetical protein
MAAIVALASFAGCGDDSAPTSSLPTPSADDLAGAKVNGAWEVALKIDSQTPPVLDDRIKAGDTLTRHYALSTGCNEVQSIECKVNRESGAGTSSEIWTRNGPTLRLHVEAPVTVDCEIDGKDTPVEYQAKVDFTLEVTDAIEIGDEWTATELAYARSASVEPGADAAAKGCRAGSQTESGTATQSQGAPSTTAAPGTTVASATTGP